MALCIDKDSTKVRQKIRPLRMLETLNLKTTRSLKAFQASLNLLIHWRHFTFMTLACIIQMRSISLASVINETPRRFLSSSFVPIRAP